MASGNCTAPLIFSATLVPHRSLGRRGFLVLMGVIGGMWFLTGIYFYRLGAWPVLGFFGLDFLAVWLAFHLNYRAARAFEEVEVSRDALVIRKISPRGRSRELRFNPAWTRLELTEAADEGLVAMAIRSRGERVPFGAFLNPDDRRSFAREFGSALAQACR
jgi:uncharacterized membrane protein